MPRPQGPAERCRGAAGGSQAGPERFFVVGSWSDWDFEELVSDGAHGRAGALHVDVVLPEDGGEFQIVVDRDWGRVLHPPPDASAACGVGLQLAVGPDDEAHGLNWLLEGSAGEAFRIELQPGLAGAELDGTSAAWLVRSRRLAGADFDGDVLHPMLAVAERSGDWEAAVAELAEMGRWGQSPGPAELSSAIRACERGSAWEAALSLLEDQWGLEKQSREPSGADYEAVARACSHAGEVDLAGELRHELGEWGPAPDDERFQLAPRVYWNRDVRRMGCSAKNTLDWQGGGPVPLPEWPSCWLLPASDAVAVEIARRQEELREAGWRVLTCEPGVVSRLDNKASFQEYAGELGLAGHLPACYSSAEDASFPCVLKPAAGEFGRNTHIVRSCNDVTRFAGDGELGSRWVLQELIAGRFEYSTSLLVVEGEVLEVACTRYEYNAEEYVWPQVRELGKEDCAVPPEHLTVMRALLLGYSGVCNFNYKLRPDGRLCIFEANARVGADLACDVPRPQARALLERLDSLGA